MILLKRLRLENFKSLERVGLVFPRQGSVLVEGLNESGKSTLFESIFFALYGFPLATEGRGKGNLEALIRYGEESTWVELLLEVDDVELEISRALRRGRPSQASLVVRRPGAPEERVAGVLAVNARVVEEMGGLDSEALLNSCFVEQKKLSKLEDLAPAQRRDSVRRLLNLDRLTALADRFRVSSQDERALALARDRLELAEVAGRLPGVVAERAKLEEQLGRLVLLGWREWPRSPCAGSCQPASLGGLHDGSGAETPEAEGVQQPNWTGEAARLAEARSRAAASRRRAAVLSAAGLVALVAIAALLASGVSNAMWGLPLVVLLSLLALAAYRTADAPSREASRLEAKLALSRDELVARIGELESRRRRLEGSLSGDAGILDPEECRREVARLARQLEVKRRAAALLEGTMERIVRLVLPSTERNMGQILPLLTAGRYHEARIAADYQIQVWDDAAGRYVSKNLFSGGAKDQFSLALRLAFALATLPQELGTTPGFIFLDEPLSSFDGPRTEALIHLLTSGQVAESFSQIFVISHNRAFDVGAFQYRLVMREGRVAESNLPVDRDGETGRVGDGERELSFPPSPRHFCSATSGCSAWSGSARSGRGQGQSIGTRAWYSW